MTDKARPKAAINLGGKERELIFDLNAMATYEEVTGKNILKLDMNKLGARDIRALLFACLQSGDRNLTIEQVGAWITPSSMRDIVGQLGNAFSAAMPEGEKDGAETGPLAG